MISAHAANKYGSKEDRFIFDVQKDLMSELGFTSQLAPPKGWLRTNAAKKAKSKIRDYLDDVYKNQNVFVFKDPKTCAFLPLWTQLFNEIRVVPIYLVAVRDYSAIASSFFRNYGVDQDQFDAIWINRHLDAMYHTGLDCYFVHYEDWFSEGDKELVYLQSYLEKFGVQTNRFDIKSILDVGSDRSREKFSVNNSVVSKLEFALRHAKRNLFDKDELFKVVEECRSRADDFYLWSQIAVGNRRKINAQSEMIQELKEHFALFQKENAEFREYKRKDQSLRCELNSIIRNIDNYFSF